MSAVSVPAKNADRNTSPTSVPISTPSDWPLSFKPHPRVCAERSAPMPAEHELENDAAPEVSERENAEAAERPVDCCPAAPAEAPAAEQEQCEHEPRSDGENGLVCEMLAEQILDEDKST